MTTAEIEAENNSTPPSAKETLFPNVLFAISMNPNTSSATNLSSQNTIFTQREILFRCPKCRVIRYCSVACYKLHKDNPEKCIKREKKLRYDKNEPVSVTGYTVSQQQFQLLSMSSITFYFSYHFVFNQFDDYEYK